MDERMKAYLIINLKVLLRLDMENLPEMFDPLKLSVPVRVLTQHIEDRVENLGVQLLSSLVLELSSNINLLNPPTISSSIILQQYPSS